MIELAGLIKTIVGVTLPIGRDILQRNESVIKLLKDLNLEPDHPPADFTGVYRYTLVEYGVGKPKSVLEIFQQSDIQQIFRKSLDGNDPTILLLEGRAFLVGNKLEDELKKSEINIEREFIEFAIVFIQVAKRTRTPAEVLTNQRIESLNEQVGKVLNRLDRLPTMEGMRTEIARLFESDLLSLPAGEVNVTKRCRAYALAQQMRGWFETLGYRFEQNEIWEDNYFEWIINIPVRRNRFDRVLVRGIEGEASISDLIALKQSVSNQKTDEGWLVAARRVSPAAKSEVEKPDNKNLECYTFDELVDVDADFSGYIQWLETEIQRRGIETKYVPLAFTKEEFDPTTKQMIAVSNYDEQDGWIDGYIDRWLDDSAKEHVSVLGEFGTGKTWFAFHYAWISLKRYQEAKERGTQRPRLPLVIPLRDYAKAVSIESLFSEFFFRKHEIPIPGYSAFEQLNRMGRLLLIFDGFDEMAARIDRQQMIDNFWQLARAIVPGTKVILTCRTEHFPEAQEGRALLNLELQSSTAILTGEKPQFEVLQLTQFNEEQIRQVLSLQTSPETVEQVMNNPALIDLASRPIMTELILEALPDIEAGKPVDMSRVYLYAIQHKMQRDITAERTFTSLADKLYFLCELSWEMLSTDRMSINYQEFPDRIRSLFSSSIQEQKDLDHWRYDMMGQTMLIRDSNGNYSPAHRSLLEFFVAYKFAAELGALHEDFLVVANKQKNINYELENKEYTWSEFFHINQYISIPPLKNFSSESFSNLRKTFGHQVLSEAVLEIMHKMIAADCVWSVLLNTDELLDYKDHNYIGGNCISLLSAINEDFKNKKLSGLNLRGAKFNSANLYESNFSSSNLAEANFTNSSFEKTNLFGADLNNTSIKEDSNVLVHLPSQEVSFFIAIKNGWIYQISKIDEIEAVKLFFLGSKQWIIYMRENGFFLRQKNSNLLSFWEFDKKQFTQTKYFDGSSIKTISCGFEDRNALLISRSNNIIEFWSFDLLELKYSFKPHDILIFADYKENKSRVVSIGKDNAIKTIKIWQVDNVVKTHSVINRLQVSEHDNIHITENHIIVSRIERVSEKLAELKIFDASDGQHIYTYKYSTVHKDLWGNSWSLNADKNIICFMREEEIILQNYLSDVVIKITTEEDLGKVNYFGLMSLEDEDDLILIIDYSSLFKIFYIDKLFNKECIYTHTFSKEYDDKLHSLALSYKDRIIIGGSEKGNIYSWNYQTGSLLFKASLNFEYEEMQIENTLNIDPDIFVFLKHHGVQGFPIMDCATKVKTSLILGLKSNISEEAKYTFLALQPLITEHFDSSNPLADYFDMIESYKDDPFFFEIKKSKLYRRIENIDWTKYPKIMQQFELFLKSMYLQDDINQL